MSSTWAEESLAGYVTEEFIREAVREEDRFMLDNPLDFADDLGGGTYIEWIVRKTKKIFLILKQIGATHRIFDIIDQAFDDDDLPFGLDEIARLELRDGGRDPQIDAAFSRAQVLLFAGSEGHPTTGTTTKPMKLSIEVLSTVSDNVDTVRTSSNRAKVFTRVRVDFGRSAKSIRKEHFLQDVEFVKRSTRQQHIISLRTAYLSGDGGYALLTPTLNISLRTFFTNIPKPFRSLPVSKQQETLLNWPHCLACALLFLHNQGLHHGKIVPSNVFIDPLSRIYLGFSVFSPTIQCQKKENEFEAFNYSPPERLTRPFDPSSHTSSHTSSPAPSTSKKLKSFSLLNRRMSRSSSSSSSGESVYSAISNTGHANFSRPFKMSSSAQSAPAIAEGPSTAQHSNNFPTLDDRSVSSRRDSSYSNFSSSSAANHRQSTAPSSNNDFDLEALRLTSSRHNNEQGCGDIYSLACITTDIFAFLIHGQPSSFTPRKKKSRLMGGSADSSFHGNQDAVNSYIEGLEESASEQSQPVFRGVVAILTLIKHMMNKNPHSRPRAIEVVRSMEEAMIQYSDLPYLHCGGGGQC